MQDGEDFAAFMEEQRSKLAYDRDRLKNHPPSSISDNTFNRQALHVDKENQIPSGPGEDDQLEKRGPEKRKPLPIQTAVRPPSTPRIFRLGDDYRKRKEKLKEELKEDYRNAMAERNYRSGRAPAKEAEFPLGARSTSDLGLSLPLKDRLSAKERMRLQRNREYNEYLLQQEERERQRRAARSLSRSPVRLAPDATPVTKYFDPTSNRNINQNTISKSSGADVGIHQRPSKAKDASTETYEELLERKRKQEKSYRGIDHEDDDRRDRPAGRYYDEDVDDGYYSQRRVRFPSKNRRSDGRRSRSRRVDDFVDYDEDEEAAYRPRRGRRRGRHRRRRRRYDSDDDSEYDSEEDEEERLPRRKRNISIERNQVIPSFEREATTGSLDIPKPKTDDIGLRSRSVPIDTQQQYTGLPVGNVASANTVQRRKEEYRDDLLRQMELDKQKKLREKQLDKAAGISSLNQSQSNKNNSNNNRKAKEGSSPKRITTSLSPPPKRSEKKKPRKVVTLDVDSSSEDEDRKQHNRYRYPPPGAYMGPLPPPPPPLGYYPNPQYPSAYSDPYSYYGARNPLDPNASIGAPPIGMYPGVSPVLAAAGVTDVGLENPQRSQKVKLNASPRRNFKNESSSLIADEDRDKEKKRQQTLEYQEELKYQIAEKNQQKLAAKRELEQYNLKKEEEARNYNPWGKGGGGAPMRDRRGNLISDLRQMHLENEEALNDPLKAEAVVKERLPQTNQYRREDRPVIDLSPRKYDGDPLSPRFGRSNPFEIKQSDEQRTQRDIYKDYLQKQIEEKKRLEAEKKEKERIEEEKEERRLEEQRKRIQAELEAEQEKERRKQEAARLKNEEVRVQAEERKKEEQAKKMQEEKEQRLLKEKELTEKLRAATQQKPEGPSSRPASRPIGTNRPPSRPLPTTKQHEQKQTPRVTHTPHSPRVQTYRAPTPQNDDERPNIPTRDDSKRISRELSALRKQLRSEQRRVEDALKSVDEMPPKKNSLVDLSKAKQKPVAVRRPPTVERERPDSSALEEFTAYKHRPDDTASIRMFRAEYPGTPNDAKALETQQRARLAQQDRNLEDLRNQAVMGAKHQQKQSTQRPKPQKPKRTTPPSVMQSRASLLDAETRYIPVNEDEDDVNSIRFHFESNQSSAPPSRQERKPSARERRRINRRTPSDDSGPTPLHRTHSDNFSLNSINSLATLDVDRIANRNTKRLDKLRIIQGDEISLNDPDDILDRFIKQKRGRPPTNEDGRGGRAGISGYRDSDSVHYDPRPPSVNTLDTEPWLRPETGPTVA